MAFALRDSGGVGFYIVAAWREAAEEEKATQWADRVWNSMQPFSPGKMYVNYLSSGSPAGVEASYGNNNYQRLVELKNKYDPGNFFRMNRNIRPTLHTASSD